VVKKPTKLGFTGPLLGSLGVVCIVWGSVREFDPVRVGVALFLAGVISIFFKKLEDQHRRLEEKNLAADEIWKIGQNAGFEDGYADGYQDGVANGERRRPHVVAPLPQCPHCGTATALHSVASVADRV
jgi:hypothetical protein